ncbi:MAG: S-layer homology domain-containing protein [Clostridia bacterium]|nr:S-layer homology domain-containing protein [Clostridia bacterium]
MKKLLCVALCLALSLSCLPMVGMAEAKVLVNFIDLNGHWAKSYVVPLAEEGIIKGKTANKFDPDGQITRAEFLTLALKVANLPAELADESWSDVTPEQWFAKAAHTAKKADIIAPEMTADGNLNPDAPILREEMTAVIMRLIDVMRGTTVDPAHSFTDTATFAPWANEYIGKAAKLGIVTGNPDGSFNAKGSATRGEAAVMFSRLKKFLEETPLFTPAGEYSPVYDAIVYEGIDLHKMINDAYEAGQKEITIAPGAYRIKTQPVNGYIRLINMKDFTINAQGVTLLLQTNAAVGIVMSGCENVTINGFNIDWEKPNVMQGQIYNIDPDGYFLDFTMEPGYPHDFDSGKMWADMTVAFFGKDAPHNFKKCQSQNVKPSQFEQLGPNTYRLNSSKALSQSDAEVGDYIAARAYKISAVTSLTKCKNITFNGLHVWSGFSSLNDSYGEGGTVWNDVHIERGPNPLGTITGRMVSTQGDGVHSAALRKGPTIINSSFEYMLDDGTNIHNLYAYVVGKEGDTALIELENTSIPTYWEGDELLFYNKQSTLQTDRLTVKKAEIVDPKDVAKRILRVTFNEKNPKFEVGDWVHNRDWACNGFEIRDSVFNNCRSRSLLVKCSDGVIENCQISYGGGYGLWIAPEMNWGESGYSENVIVRNCTVFRSGWEGRETSAGMSISGYAGQDHHNIIVENCTFYENFNADLHISDGTDFTVRNNTFKAGAINAEHSLEATNLDKVTLEGNTFEGNRKDNVHITDTVTNCKQS